jgi:hypothetical protein
MLRISMLRSYFTALAALFLTFLLVPTVTADPPREYPDAILGPAPVLPEWLNLPEPNRAPRKGGGLVVNTQSRSAVASFFDTYYTPNLSVPMSWTGSIGGCNAGTTAQAYIDATLEMVNYYRAMTGLSGDIANDTALTPGSQDAALMMIAEGNLSHAPPPTWACYTAAGADTAGASNLALGNAGPSAVRAYVQDSGTFNTPVGHRRWILFPLQGDIGTGSNDGVNIFQGANDLYVLAVANWVSRPPLPIEVAWPPAGFVPYQVVYDRWSLSLNTDPNANYAAATVTMTRTIDGSPVTTSIVSTTDSFGDKTVVWEPSGLVMGQGMEDLTVTVTVANIGNSSTTSVTYDVTIIDPAIVGDDIFSDGFETGDTSLWSP